MSTNTDLERRRIAAVPRGVSVSLPVFVERALNAELIDVEGRRYIDFAAGIAVLNTRHLHPKVEGRRGRATRIVLPHLLSGHTL
jgi:4-aminobutyrate aminotransferase / (S)-3-amino-2-methylpropionate transaminase / 5-aminovalerate transaminase